MTFDGFIGIPAAPRGFDRAGAHCYGLVVIVYAEALAIALSPDVDPAEWVRLDRGNEEPYDVVLLHDRPWHVGLVARRGDMLHLPEDGTSCIEPYTTGRHGRRIDGIYRHVSRLGMAA